MGFDNWTVAAGSWPIHDDAVATYEKSSGEEQAGRLLAPDGPRLIRGSISVMASLLEGRPSSQARIMFARDPRSRRYMTAGIGGYNARHAIDEYFPEADSLQALTVGDSTPNGPAPRKEKLTVTIRGRHITLKAGSAPLLEADLDKPIGVNQLGLFAWGEEPIKFSSFKVRREKPQAFVVMQFSGYKPVFDEVISTPLTKRLSLDRADKHAKPGNIPEDVRKSILNSDVVIAEITPDNGNVFYELGYAHACEIPTILLVREKRKIPFDVAPERCIVYKNTPAGRRKAADELIEFVKDMKLI
jgi:hypothetical protein